MMKSEHAGQRNLQQSGAAGQRNTQHAKEMRKRSMRRKKARRMRRIKRIFVAAIILLVVFAAGRTSFLLHVVYSAVRLLLIVVNFVVLHVLTSS